MTKNSESNKLVFSILIFRWFEKYISLTFSFLFGARFQTDETSPAIWDPMNPEDYCYDILSKTLMRKTQATNDTISKE